MDSDQATFTVPLSALIEQWPEPLKLELAQMNLGDAQLALPLEVVEKTLKLGKLAFAWKVMRSWVRPTPVAAVSAHDGVNLELSMRVVTPLFLAALQKEKEAKKGQQKVEIDANIPNLFFGFPQGEGADAQGEGGGAQVAEPNQVANPISSHAVSSPTDTNYYVWDDTSEGGRDPIEEEAEGRH
jgi:hypothetical protein